MRRASLAGCLFFGLGASSVALADVSPTDKATAQALFDQAKQLAVSGKYAEACPKFEESERLDPGIGTQFQLASCFEHAGRIASAWTLFLEVASAAHGMKQPEREKVARDRAAALEAKIPKLTIAVAGADGSPDIEVKRDGVLMGRAQWGAALPCDPGEHVVTAQAPGKKRFEKRLQVAAGGTASVAIPPLENAEATATAGTPAAPMTPPGSSSHVETSERAGSSQRTIGLVVAGVGVVGLGVGGVLGLAAKSRFNEAASNCDDRGCDQTGVDLRHSAVLKGNVATIVLGAGIAGVAVGGLLWATSPKAEARVAVGPGSIFFAGRF